jgi:hypothetical protein
MPEIHELPDDELKEKLASAELGEKKAAIARATLRRRRRERVQEWLKRHGWFAGVLASLGILGWLSLGRSANSDES